MNNGKQIHIVIGDQQEARDGTFDPQAFAAVPALVEEGTTYIVATDANDCVHRLASTTEHDRQIVGALTGSWVAQGYRVRTVTSLQELVKLLRKSIKREGEGEAAAATNGVAAAATPAAQSGEPTPVGESKDPAAAGPQAGEAGEVPPAHLNGASKAANDSHQVFQ